MGHQNCRMGVVLAAVTERLMESDSPPLDVVTTLDFRGGHLRQSCGAAEFAGSWNEGSY